MSEWWTYRPSDFLMFSARSYARMVESYNEEMWPWQVLLIALGLALTWFSWRGTRGRGGRMTFSLALALAWAWVAWAFHWQRFSQINTAASYMAWAFGAQAVLLAALGGVGGLDGAAPAARLPARMVGTLVCGIAVVLYPLLAPLSAGRWTRAEVFGLMPEPTALATIGVLIASRPRHRGLLAVIPVVSLVIGLGTAWLLWRASPSS